MAVDNSVILLTIGYVFTYLIVYKHNKLYGSILFVLLGLLSVFVTDNDIGAALTLIALIVLYFHSNEVLQKIWDKKSKAPEW